MPKTQSLPKSVRLAYRVDAEPVNGWVLARCDALDLVCQGRTSEDARLQLIEEAGLLVAQAGEQGTLTAWVDRLAASPAGEGETLDLDLARLP
jgi:hypothetical protein